MLSGRLQRGDAIKLRAQMRVGAMLQKIVRNLAMALDKADHEGAT